MGNLIIVGEGGLGHEVLDLVIYLQDNGLKSYDEILFLDDDIKKTGYRDYKVLQSETVYNNYSPENTSFVIAIGETVHRIKFINELKKRGYKFETLIHPTAWIGNNTSIGEGTVVQKGAFISCDCSIGENCFFQPLSNLGHDCTVDDDCIISTNTVISGDVKIGKDTYIAIGVPVIQGVSIGSNSVVGMGSVVLRDIPDNVVALGNPARAIKNRDESRIFS